MKNFFKQKSMKFFFWLGFFIVGGVTLFIILSKQNIYFTQERAYFWQFQSIDTMKYSRDLSREKIHDPAFDEEIDRQVKNIASTGANYVAIATPYDEEFTRILKRWVASARKYNLKVWFRGNWSGWEKWFGYESIDRQTHINKTKEFILNNHDLFEDGDIFSSCPECENGGTGDPRQHDLEGFREFIITEYQTTKSAFSQINKKVASNYFSMNADVARAVMDRETTKALDGIVTIDHYVATPEQLVQDAEDIADKSGGKVVLGEFGAPIPDIHGDMTEDQQSEWIYKSLFLLSHSKKVVGVNYWVNVGGSTSLWSRSGASKKAVSAIKKVYSPPQISGVVIDESGHPVKGAIVKGSERYDITSTNGSFVIPTFEERNNLFITAKGYKPETAYLGGSKTVTVVLKSTSETMSFKFRRLMNLLLKPIWQF